MKVYGSDDPEVSRGKPHPDIFTVAASRFDLHHHLLLNILAQVWSATSLARELPGHRGQHGWCGGWAPCRDAGDQLIISRYKLRVGKSANLSRWWWWPTGAPAIQEQRQCCPPWKSSALKNGDCQPWRGSKKEKIPCDTNITHYLHTQHIPINLKTSPPQFNLLLFFYLCRSFTLHFFVRVCGWLSNIHTSGPNPWFEIFFHHDATSSKIFIDGNIFIYQYIIRWNISYSYKVLMECHHVACCPLFQHIEVWFLTSGSWEGRVVAFCQTYLLPPRRPQGLVKRQIQIDER